MITKKAYTLLISLFLISIFSYLSIFILQTKSIQHDNLKNQYLYLQAQNHKEFLKKYIKLQNLEQVTSIKIDDDIFDIKAVITKNEDSSFNIDIYVNTKKHNISIYETIKI